MNIVIPKKWMAAVICGTTFVSILLLTSISASPEIRAKILGVGLGLVILGSLTGTVIGIIHALME